MTPFLASAIAEMIPKAGDTDRCAECGFAWESAAVACRARVDGAAETFERLLDSVDDGWRSDGPVGTDAAVHGGESDVGWSAAAYVWHVADVVRAWSERLHTLSVDPSIPWAAFDPDDLAEARRYDELPAVSAPWAVSRAVEALSVVLGRLGIDEEFVHPEWGYGTVGDALRWLAHEVVHHELDVRRALGLRA